VSRAYLCGYTAGVARSRETFAVEVREPSYAAYLARGSRLAWVEALQHLLWMLRGEK